jgi:hypothetical protein
VEVVLLWLDDIDDLVFALALKWEQLRRSVLRVGFVAALAVAACESSLIAIELTPALSVVAAASVTAWFLGAVLRVAYYRELPA